MRRSQWHNRLVIGLAIWVVAFTGATMYLLYHHIQYQIGVNKNWGSRVVELEDWKKDTEMWVVKMDGVYLVMLEQLDDRIREAVKYEIKDGVKSDVLHYHLKTGDIKRPSWYD
jgi:hypothetical protein